MLWSYTAGLKNKTFPSALVGISDEKVIEVLMQRVKKKAKRNFLLMVNL